MTKLPFAFLLTGAFAALVATAPVRAELYAYVNEQGDYVVTQERPGKKDAAEYAVLTDDGEFLHLVRPRELDVPITHWRPWFLPKEPDPFDADPDMIYTERESIVEIEEMARETEEDAPTP